jgi:hypothetical protein
MLSNLLRSKLMLEAYKFNLNEWVGCYCEVANYGQPRVFDRIGTAVILKHGGVAKHSCEVVAP